MMVVAPCAQHDPNRLTEHLGAKDNSIPNQQKFLRFELNSVKVSDLWLHRRRATTCWPGAFLPSPVTGPVSPTPVHPAAAPRWLPRSASRRLAPHCRRTASSRGCAFGYRQAHRCLWWPATYVRRKGPRDRPCGHTTGRSNRMRQGCREPFTASTRLRASRSSSSWHTRTHTRRIALPVGGLPQGPGCPKTASAPPWRG